MCVCVAETGEKDANSDGLRISRTQNGGGGSSAMQICKIFMHVFAWQVEFGGGGVRWRRGGWRVEDSKIRLRGGGA